MTNIAHLEALNLVVALRTLSPHNPQGYIITINTDNHASQQVLSTGAGRDHILTACAREIWLFAATNSCEVEILHKPGKDLILADALSRRSFNSKAKIIATDICKTLALTEITVNFNNIFTAGL